MGHLLNLAQKSPEDTGLWLVRYLNVQRRAWRVFASCSVLCAELVAYAAVPQENMLSAAHCDNTEERQQPRDEVIAFYIPT